jgi:hypothetical protein
VPTSTPTVTADGTVYFYLHHGGLESFGFNGQRKGDIYLCEVADTSPAIGANGAILAGCSGGSFYAVSNAAPLAKSAWPMFRHDPRHTGKAARPD